MQRNRGVTVVEILIGLAVLVILGALAIAAVGCRTGHPGDGTSVGTIVNVANHGLLWSRPEVYVLHTGEMKAEEFGIEESLVPVAQQYSGTGTRLRIHYTEYLFCAAWNYANCAVIDKIDPESQEVERRPAQGQ